MDADKCHIYCLHQPERLDSAIHQRLLSVLPMTMQSDINAYKHWQSAQAGLLGKILIQYAFLENGISFVLQDILFTEKERPYVNGAIDFNLSNSGAYVMLAITETGSVGIDIEKHRTIRPSLFQKYFDATEWMEIEQSREPEKTFFQLWAIKESAIKCDGRGVEVLSRTHRQYDTDTVLCDGRIFHFSQLDIAPDYAAAVAVTKPLQMEISHLHVADLLSRI